MRTFPTLRRTAPRYVTRVERAVRQPLAIGATILLAAAFARAQEPYASQIAAMVPRVEQAVGLPFKTPPRFEVRSRAEIEHRLAHSFDGERPRAALVAEQTAMRLLGLIPDTLDWRALQLAIGNALVVGFYDPATKVLYLEDEPDDPQLGIVIPHELVHALQDQYMNLDSVENLKGDDDRSLAAAAVIEGQATLVPLQAALGGGVELPNGWERVREAIRENQSSMPVMARTPEFLQEILIFPYLSGAEFVHRFQKERPGHMPYNAELPASTSQIMHPREYFNTPPELPITVTLPAPRAGTLDYDNVMGEFTIKVMLYDRLRDQNQAAAAADGWSGDRYALVKTAGGEGVAWLAVFRSAVDAGEFAQAMRSMAELRYPKAPERTSGVTTTISASGRTVTIWGGEVAGRAAVLYQDVPAGVQGQMFDLAKVRLN